MVEIFTGHMKVRPCDWQSLGDGYFKVLKVPSRNNLPISVFRIEKVTVMHYGYIPAGTTIIHLAQLHAVQIGDTEGE